ncbi:MAG TPA: GAF domain-containing protein, partial [Armatimonadetes bacterium]|nr:GAF domain-containing protein [Armatimonadota bacterium]
LQEDPATADIPVIFVSARAELQDRVAGLDLGARDYIAKPFEMDELRARVETALRIKALEDELRAKNEELERLYQQSQADRLAKLAALHEVSGLLMSSAQLDQALETIVAVTARTTQSQVCRLFLIDWASGELRAETTHCLEGAERLDRLISPAFEKAVAMQVLEREEPVQIEDLRQDIALGMETYPRPVAMLSVPLLARGRPVGTLSLIRESETNSLASFGEEETHLLATFAAQAAVAIENAELFDRFTRKSKELSALFEIGAAATANENLDDMLSQIVNSTVSLMEAEVGILKLLDEANSVCIVAQAGRPRSMREKDYQRMAQELAERTVRQRAPVQLRDERLMRLPQSETHGLSALLSVPLLGQTTLRGALIVGSVRPRLFTQEEIDFLLALAREATMVIENALLVRNLRRYYLRTIEALSSALEAKDAYTKGHSQRVADLASAIAEWLDFSPREVEDLKIAGYLHDIGKIGVLEGLLLKPSALDDLEFALMRRHLIQSVNIIEPVGLSERILRAISHHHERLDGTGYPRGLRGEQVSLEGNILGVADAFDAMTSNRPYRPAMNPEEALAEIKAQVGKQFRPEVVEALEAVLQNGVYQRAA